MRLGRKLLIVQRLRPNLFYGDRIQYGNQKPIVCQYKAKISCETGQVPTTQDGIYLIISSKVPSS